MKLRRGFVSNSSSSSFVIAVDKPSKCEHCGRSDMDILEMIERSGSNGCSDDNDVRTLGKEAVINEISWYLAPVELKKITKLINSVSDDKKVALVSVSYHDDILNDLVKNSKNIKILWGNGGD
jgi:hypothetical protein